MIRTGSIVFAMLALVVPGHAQRNLSGASATQLALDRLNVTASALMIAAHPDDENTALLAYLARGRKVRTGYLSLTRGEGGQNLIGPEQGHLLGVIRTQELLAARRVDGAEQFFTRAVDFGFTKTANEALETWGGEKVLGDIVWVIRKFRPDVIILRFSGTPRDGHGQHQASAILGKEAFAAAADPSRFPEQLKHVGTWQAKRVMWNVFSFSRDSEKEAATMPDRVEVDVGAYDPLLGYSYTEIAGQSRSLHQSQGMGSPERRGSHREYLVNVAGDPPKTDLFDGVALAWNGEVASLLRQAAQKFEPRHPDRTVPILMKARRLINIDRKRRDLDDAVAMCAGLWLDASVDRPLAVGGEQVRVSVQALNRSALPMTLASVALEGAPGAPAGALEKPLLENSPVQQSFEWTVAKPDRQPSIEMPEPDPVLSARFRILIAGEPLEFIRPVIHRFVDRVHGELTRPFAIVPPVAISFATPSTLLPGPGSRAIDVHLRAFARNVSGAVRLSLPPGWHAKPEGIQFTIARAGDESVAHFSVTPPARPSVVEARANVEIAGASTGAGVQIVNYPHIPAQAVLAPAKVTLTRADVTTLARRVGYVMGAGDVVPDSLRQLGCAVTLLSADELTSADLSGFDAIVTGVRAYNVRQDLRANHHRLMEYVRNGGTVVVQYNVLEGGFMRADSSALENLGPFPIKIGRERVSVEQAPVTILAPNHPLLNRPNKITPADFEDWVQERGLYFASNWDPKYHTILASSDPGEKPLPSGLLYTRFEKGVYIFTAYSWFRQLPAGVPGAYRIFANLLSAGKAQ